MFGLTEAAKRTHIPERTIRGWAKTAGLDLTKRSAADLLLPRMPAPTKRDNADRNGTGHAEKPSPTPSPGAGETAPDTARAGADTGESAATPTDPFGDTLNFEARLRLKRLMIREELVQQLHKALLRMDEAHIEFVTTKDDVHEVKYPKAPAVAFRAYAQAFATLFKEFRLEVGETTDRTETTSHILDVVKDDHERDLLKRAIDEALKMDVVEAKRDE